MSAPGVRRHRRRAASILLALAGVCLAAGVSFAFAGVSDEWRLIAVAEAAVLTAAGARLPRAVVDVLAVAGVGLVAFALAIPVAHRGDVPALCAFPMLGAGAVLGRRGAAGLMVLVLAADVVLLAALTRLGAPPRWVDVVLSGCVVICIIGGLEERNRRLIEMISREARVDVLTGLLNRRGFAERAEIEMSHLRRERRPLAVVMFDIDHFKRINDDWGHDAGDRVLCDVGAALGDAAREIDVVARLGGEEFVVLLPGSDVEGARAYADRVRARVGAKAGDAPRVRLSAGVVAGSAGEDVAALLAAADSAMYAAKRTGRDRTWVARDGHVADEPGEPSTPRPATTT